MEWRLLGSPGNLFGFSRTPSWGFDWAKDACSRQLGQVTLANLDTHFDDVKWFIANNYPGRKFWVDATRRDGGNLDKSYINVWSIFAAFVVKSTSSKIINSQGHHHYHHQSFNCEGLWGTTDDFKTSFLHFFFFCSPLPSGTWRTPGLSIP